MGYCGQLDKTNLLYPLQVNLFNVGLWKKIINQIVSLHEIPLSIISDRGSQFTSRFWMSLQKGLVTQVKLSFTFNPQTDVQAERTVQTLKYMLSAFVIDFKGNWDYHLSLIEFSNNNNYYSGISMEPLKHSMVGV